MVFRVQEGAQTLQRRVELALGHLREQARELGIVQAEQRGERRRRHLHVAVLRLRRLEQTVQHADRPVELGRSRLRRRRRRGRRRARGNGRHHGGRQVVARVRKVRRAEFRRARVLNPPHALEGGGDDVEARERQHVASLQAERAHVVKVDLPSIGAGGRIRRRIVRVNRCSDVVSGHDRVALVHVEQMLDQLAVRHAVRHSRGRGGVEGAQQRQHVLRVHGVAAEVVEDAPGRRRMLVVRYRGDAAVDGHGLLPAIHALARLFDRLPQHEGCGYEHAAGQRRVRRQRTLQQRRRQIVHPRQPHVDQARAADFGTRPRRRERAGVVGEGLDVVRQRRAEEDEVGIRRVPAQPEQRVAEVALHVAGGFALQAEVEAIDDVLPLGGCRRRIDNRRVEEGLEAGLERRRCGRGARLERPAQMVVDQHLLPTLERNGRLRCGRGEQDAARPARRLRSERGLRGRIKVARRELIEQNEIDRAHRGAGFLLILRSDLRERVPAHHGVRARRRRAARGCRRRRRRRRRHARARRRCGWQRGVLERVIPRFLKVLLAKDGASQRDKHAPVRGRVFPLLQLGVQVVLVNGGGARVVEEVGRWVPHQLAKVIDDGVGEDDVIDLLRNRGAQEVPRVRLPLRHDAGVAHVAVDFELALRGRGQQRVVIGEDSGGVVRRAGRGVLEIQVPERHVAHEVIDVAAAAVAGRVLRLNRRPQIIEVVRVVREDGARVGAALAGVLGEHVGGGGGIVVGVHARGVGHVEAQVGKREGGAGRDGLRERQGDFRRVFPRRDRRHRGRAGDAGSRHDVAHVHVLQRAEGHGDAVAHRRGHHVLDGQVVRVLPGGRGAGQGGAHRLRQRVVILAVGCVLVVEWEGCGAIVGRNRQADARRGDGRRGQVVHPRAHGLRRYRRGRRRGRGRGCRAGGGGATTRARGRRRRRRGSRRRRRRGGGRLSFRVCRAGRDGHGRLVDDARVAEAEEVAAQCAQRGLVRRRDADDERGKVVVVEAHGGGQHRRRDLQVEAFGRRREEEFVQHQERPVEHDRGRRILLRDRVQQVVAGVRALNRARTRVDKVAQMLKRQRNNVEAREHGDKPCLYRQHPRVLKVHAAAIAPVVRHDLGVVRLYLEVDGGRVHHVVRQQRDVLGKDEEQLGRRGRGGHVQQREHVLKVDLVVHKVGEELQVVHGVEVKRLGGDAVEADRLLPGVVGGEGGVRRGHDAGRQRRAGARVRREGRGEQRGGEVVHFWQPRVDERARGGAVVAAGVVAGESRGEVRKYLAVVVQRHGNQGQRRAQLLQLDQRVAQVADAIRRAEVLEVEVQAVK